MYLPVNLDLDIRVTNKSLFFSDESLDKQNIQKLKTFILLIHQKIQIN